MALMRNLSMSAFVAGHGAKGTNSDMAEGDALTFFACPAVNGADKPKLTNGSRIETGRAARGRGSSKIFKEKPRLAGQVGGSAYVRTLPTLARLSPEGFDRCACEKQYAKERQPGDRKQGHCGDRPRRKADFSVGYDEQQPAQ